MVFAAASLHAAAAPAITFAPHVFKADDGTEVDAELGELRVPENRANPTSQTITLRFVRFASTSPKPGAPIVYLAGGPGGSGIGAARSARFPLFMALRAYGDVIALDQRGTGQSTPSLECPGIYIIDPSRALTRATAVSGFSEPLSKCAAALRAKGIDLGGYNTRESAHDLNDLRAALGAPKITLWGISYGTFLALATLKEHPDAIDRMILAGIEPLDATSKLPSDQQALLTTIAGLAKRARVHPDLLGGIARVSAALAAEPRTVSLVDPRSGQPVALTVGRLDLQFVIAQMLTGPDSFAILPDFIQRLEGGDWMALALAAGAFRVTRMPSAMSMDMDCASGETAERHARIAAEAKSTLLEDAINLPLPDVCPTLGVPDLGDEFRKPVRSGIPVLLISGTLDGRTPPSQAEAVRAGLPKAVHLIIDGAGHSDPLFLSSPKILQAMQQFLSGRKVTITRASTKTTPFITPRHPVTLTEAQLDKLAGEYRLDEKTIRKIVRLGPLLFSQRTGGPMNPMRPTSPTEFFFESNAVTLKFELDPEGRAIAMTARQIDGKVDRAVRIPK
jgi:pimeloyl-ACP methyl ester carboxylesterase